MKDKKTKNNITLSRILYNTSYFMHGAPDISITLLRIAAKAREAIRVDVCGIWLKNSKGKLEPRVYYGVKTDFANLLFSKQNTKLLQCVIKRDTPICIYNLSRYCKDNLKKHVKIENLNSLLAYPVYVDKKRVGIIAVCARGVRYKFTKTDSMLLSMFADEIGAGLKNKKLTEKIKRDYLNTIRTIAHILETSDKYTYGHSSKVMRHAVNICKLLKLKQKQIYLIKNAALLHDIGKIGIDQPILRKEGMLSQGEWDEVKKHPVIGAKIIEQAGFLDDLIPLIKHHHAHFAGGGYPDPELTDERIPLGCKIIAIADAYDAMTSSRAYRKEPMEIEVALAEIYRKTGTQFDPEISRIFIKHILQETKKNG